MRERAFAKLLNRRAGSLLGLTSVCSAHPMVIEAALRQGRARKAPVLIEATCNQINQEGGYTGMTPADFRALVERIAGEVGFDRSDLLLGGDHLGPNPWKALDAEAAIAKAQAMVAAYVEAGFAKIHLDASMGCAGEPASLDDECIANRAVRLAQAAEASAMAKGLAAPVYVIGTEVPPPGGAGEDLGHLTVTGVEAVRQTVEIHRRAFAKAGLDAAFERVIGLVVQPGVEFGSASVAHYDATKTVALRDLLAEFPGIVFEAHSTDYQLPGALIRLVADGFAILKVGPGLTFALREALYGLDHIADALDGRAASPSLEATMEALMLAAPSQWQGHYGGQASWQRIQRHYSYSDRIRYYWSTSEAIAAVDRLMARLGDRLIPQPLVSQYLGRLAPLVASGAVEARARPLILAAIGEVLGTYAAACSPH